MLAEALGAVSALQQEGFTRRGAAERPFQFARFAREYERRIAGELTLGLGQRCEVLIDRRLLDRLHSPTVRGPSLVRHSCTPRYVLRGGFWSENGDITS